MSEVNEILLDWLLNINCKTIFTQISENQYPALMKVHEKRNFPILEVLRNVKDEFPDFDISIFCAKVHYFEGGKNFSMDDEIKLRNLLDDMELFYEFDIQILNKWIFENMHISMIRKGDVVCFISKERRYCNDYTVIFNGTSFQHLEDKYDEYNHLPHNFHIQDYPSIHYFQNIEFKEQVIAHNNIVWLRCFKDCIPILLCTFGKVKKYKTPDNYIIYTQKEDFVSRYVKENQIEVINSFENFMDIVNEDSEELEVDTSIRVDFLEQNKNNLNILFYINLIEVNYE